MPRSTASFIAYEIRPEKQIERRALVETLYTAQSSGYDIKSYRYVGFGGTKFIDFQLMERFIGFNSYVSVEHDADLIRRCSFNKPFSKIDMFDGPLTDFLVSDPRNTKTVYWADMEIGLLNSLRENLNSLAEHVSDGDMVFVTISAEPPSGTRNKTDKQRKDILKSRFPSISNYINKIPISAFSDKRFGSVAIKILDALIRSAFSTRISEGKYNPIFKVIYSDTHKMCTVGGLFSEKQSRKAAKFNKSACKRIHPICSNKMSDYFEIPKFNYTELEKVLLDKSDISTGNGYTRRLTNLGLSPEEMESYQLLSRFIPRYVESAF